MFQWIIKNVEIRTKTNVNSDEPSFYPYSVEVDNIVVVVTILIIHKQNYVFLMLLKT